MVNKYKLYQNILDREEHNRKLKKKQQLQIQQRQKEPQKQQNQIRSALPSSASSPHQATRLKTRFDYTCERCKQPIIFHTLFINDFTNHNIPLDPDMRPHRCPKRKKDKGLLDLPDR